MTTRFISTSDGTRIAYDVTGDGPPLMLLHGAGKDRKDWVKGGYIQRLKDKFTVINVDIRGCGESSYLTDIDDFTIEKICADLFAIGDACQAERFAIWGYSFGGNIARYLAFQSNRVSAMAIIGVPFGPADDEAFDRFIDEYLDRWDSLIKDYHEGRMSEKERKSKIKGHIPVFAACFQAMRNWPNFEPSDVRCPTLLLVGTKNKNTMNYVESNQGALEAADIQVELIQGLTHSDEFSQIDKVYPAVNAFLLDNIDN
jgi:pimeloyl-ACP methyl ester carboxylesterase